MNQVLDYIFLDNSLRDYLWVLGTILLILLLKKYLSRYIAGLLFRLMKNVLRDMDRASFTALLLKPLQGFLAILVTLLALDRLRFPSLFNFRLFHVTVQQSAESIALVMLIISFVWLLLRLVEFISILLKARADRTPDHIDNQLLIFFRDFLKVVIIINGFLLILKFAFHFNISSLITALSIGGAAIALATRESLENLIASFIIFLDRPFTIGDLVKLPSVTGTIEKIGLRSTRIRTDAKTFVTVPNKQMVDSIMDNLSLRTQRRAQIVLELAPVTSADQLQELLVQIRELMAGNPALETYSVFFADIHRNSYSVQAEFFTATLPIADFNSVRQDINVGIIRIIEKLGLKLAEPASERNGLL